MRSCDIYPLYFASPDSYAVTDRGSGWDRNDSNYARSYLSYRGCCGDLISFRPVLAVR